MTGSPSDENPAKVILNDALDLPPDQRDDFLRHACGGDEELYREVKELLAFDAPETDILEQPLEWILPASEPEADDLESLEGTQVGSYRLRRLLGSGGMGLVYLADRLGEVEGEVAVKLIKRGMNSAALEARFRRERQVLARLSHPNIAHFIDGGITGDGRPFFVLEFVDGDPITRFVESQGLSVEARVRLFLKVLEAVAFAHQNLVVHRDIKPSNIFVTRDGHPKLLDFGVAKVLDEEGEDCGGRTQFGARILTPSYSSPEQIRGEPLSTAADVYSLGVVLYELLTGRRPFDLDGSPFHEVRDVVSQRNPTRPSSVLFQEPSRAAGVDPGEFIPREDTASLKRLKRTLAGDLDAIILKALRKEPEERYPSARDLHADLCRYLDGRPVLARKGSTAYRFRKFFARHHTVVTAAAVVAIVAGIGGGLFLQQRGEATRQRLIAEQRVEDVRSLVNTLAFDVHDEVAGLAGSTRARKLILDRAFERLELVRRDVPADPDLLMNLAGIYRRLGDVQGNPNGPSMGDFSAARASYSEGLRLAERSIFLDPQNLVRSRGMGLLHERYATTLAFRGEIQEGVDGLQAALDVYHTIAEAFPDSVRHQLTWVIGRVNLSDHLGHPSYPNLGRTEEAVAGYRAAAARLESGVMASDSSAGVMRFRGLAQERLGRMLRAGGDLVGALAAEESSLTSRETLYALEPADNDIQRDVGVSNQNVCSIKVLMGRTDDARESCDRAAALFEQRFLTDSLNVGNLKDLTLIHRTYEELFRTAGDTAQALAHIEEVIGWSRRRLVLDSGSLPPRFDLVDALLTRAMILVKGGEPVSDFQAIQALVEALRTEGHLSDYDLDRFEELQKIR